jgi:hypothetical protein
MGGKELIRSSSRGYRIVLWVAFFFLLLGIAEFAPVLKGRIPFPSDIVLQFPPFHGIPAAKGIDPSNHAEMGDVVTQIFPWRAFAKESIRNREIPLWNPYILSGTPFQANGQSALFYPPNWIFYLLPMPIAWTASLLLKIILLGTFTFLLARALGCSVLAAVGAGVVLTMSGFFWAWLPWQSVDSALWLPLMCFAVYRLHQKGRGTILAGFSFAMPVLAGHPETVIYVTGLTTLFAVCLCANTWITRKDAARASRFLLLFLVSGLIATGIAAVQLLPTLHWLQFTYRSLSMPWGSLRFAEAAALFSRDLSHNPNVSGIQIPAGAAYAGAFALIMIPVSWFFPNRRLAIWFSIVLFLAFAVAFGLEPLASISQWMPILHGLKKDRMLLIVDFALALMCGMGLSAVETNKNQNRRPILRLAFIACVLALIGTTCLGHSRVHVQWWRAPGSIIPFLVAALALAAARTIGRLPGRKFAVGALALLVIDLGSYAYGHIPFVGPETLYPPAPVFDFLKTHSQPFRIVSVNTAAGMNFEPMYGQFAAGGFDIMLKRITDFACNAIENDRSFVSFDAGRLIRTPNHIIDMLNVKYLLATTENESAGCLLQAPDRFTPVFMDGSALVFENRHTIDFATVVPTEGVQVIKDENAQLARVTGEEFDPRRQVVLPESPALMTNRIRPSDGQESHLSGYVRHANRFHFEIDSPFSGVLVVSEMHFPGWRVYVDGVEQPLLRANYAFMAAGISSGRHRVLFEFHPAVFYWGLGISLVTLLAIVMTAIVLRLQRTEPRPYA